jgi:predicted transcriptional regulator
MPANQRVGIASGNDSALLLTPVFRNLYAYCMELNLAPDVQRKLTSIAAARGSNPELLAQEAIERFVDHDESFVREVEKGLASADREELLNHEEVGHRLDRLVATKSSHR